MSEPDLQALLVAYLVFSGHYVDDAPFYSSVETAIQAYNQEVCRPFKDAPKDEAVIEAWDKNNKCWVPILHTQGRWKSATDWNHIGVNQDMEVFTNTEALRIFTYYRIPYNPEEG